LPPQQRWIILAAAVADNAGAGAYPGVSRWVLVASMTAMFTFVSALLLYPLFAGSVFDRYGPRAVGSAFAIAGAASLVWQRRRARSGGTSGAAAGPMPAAGIAVLGAAAALFDHRLPLQLVASWCFVFVGAAFLRSLARDVSLIERFVQLIHPYAPDFVGPYCRKLTAGWGIFLAGHGVVLAVLALFAPSDWWRTYTIWVVVPMMLGGSLVEYVIRKTWFRYYPYGGPIDRLFSTFFPAENTEMGRRSHAYILARRRALGRDLGPEC
jgi:uncharacterized membrane protein